MLLRELAKEVGAGLEAMLAPNQSYRVGVLPVVCITKLRDVCGNAETCDAADGVTGEAAVKGVRRRRRKVESNAAIIETEFVCCGGTKRISVAECPPESSTNERVIKARQHADYAVRIESRITGVVVVQPTEAQ